MDVKSKLMIPVRVQPRGSRSEISGVADGRLRVKTMAPPTDGRANLAVGRLLAKEFGVPPSRVSLKYGASGRNKTFLVEYPEVFPDWLKDITFR